MCDAHPVVSSGARLSSHHSRSTNGGERSRREEHAAAAVVAFAPPRVPFDRADPSHRRVSPAGNESHRREQEPDAALVCDARHRIPAPSAEVGRPADHSAASVPSRIPGGTIIACSARARCHSSRCLTRFRVVSFTSLQAPVPLICGVDHLPSAFEFTKGTVVVDLERDKVVVHDDDQQILSNESLPGFGDLSQSLSGLTKQLKRGGGAAAALFPKPHFAVDVVIRRVRQHIEYLLDTCSNRFDASGNNGNRVNNRSGNHDLLRTFMQSQMYYKYQDDNQDAASQTPCKEDAVHEASSPATVPSLPVSVKTRSERLEEWKAAAGVLFHFAMTGVSAVERETEACQRDDCAADVAASLADNNDFATRGDRGGGKSGDKVVVTRSRDAKHLIRTWSNQSSTCACLTDCCSCYRSINNSSNVWVLIASHIHIESKVRRHAVLESIEISSQQRSRTRSSLDPRPRRRRFLARPCSIWSPRTTTVARLQELSEPQQLCSG